MIYNNLAKIYDGLVGDEVAFNKYVDFIKNNCNNFNDILELGCGSGEIALKLINEFPNAKIDATDLSDQMLDQARLKDKNNSINFYNMDMRNIDVNKLYDLVFCVCDSINYIEIKDLEEMFLSVYQILKRDGVFIFDMHSLDRLVEFEEEFYEAGIVDNIEYTWSIISDKMDIVQNFMFYDQDQRPVYEHHIQHVFDPKIVINLLNKIGFKVDIYTDFDKVGIKEGEKYFLVCKKG